MPQDLGRVVVAYSASDLRDNDNFVVLTETAFCIASLPRTALNQVKGLLEDGTPVRQVLGTTARIIPLNAVQAVQCSNKDLTLSLGYLDGSRRAETTVQYVGIGFQETFAALRKQLGPGWHETAKPSTPWSAMTLPLVVLGVLLVFIGLAFGATLQDEAGMVFMRRGKKVLGRGIAGWLPSYGWLIVGALVIAACLLWLVYAVRNRPPAAVQITRSPE